MIYTLLLVQLTLETCYESRSIEVVLVVLRDEKWLQGEVILEEKFLGRQNCRCTLDIYFSCITKLGEIDAFNSCQEEL